jgi:hypothetical protein
MELLLSGALFGVVVFGLWNISRQIAGLYDVIDKIRRILLDIAEQNRNRV